ncbi:hypothetical protein DLE01_25575 [Streptomyces sp. FT05W]|nr:hypothetical protein DLE01_25575 [Streptomyces sp. FT05W]
MVLRRALHASGFRYCVDLRFRACAVGVRT